MFLRYLLPLLLSFAAKQLKKSRAAKNGAAQNTAPTTGRGKTRPRRS